jgi:hypothetical protein
MTRALKIYWPAALFYIASARMPNRVVTRRAVLGQALNAQRSKGATTGPREARFTFERPDAS